MIELDKDTLRKLQMTELELLTEVDRICRKCHIHYNIIAGTMLGAVRHGGFIPWDDDADVALLRPEYERFCKACKTELDPARFYFQDQNHTSGYRWGYGKLRRKNTLFLREHQEHFPYEQGIFIDVFPLDYVPENYGLRCLHNFICFLYRKFFWSEAGRVSDQRALMRVLYNLMSRVPEKMLKKSFNRFIQRSNRKKSEWVRILTYPTPNRFYGYRKEWYANSAGIRFEDRILQGIRDYDRYLTFKFGNYMELPKKSERKAHPVSAVRVEPGINI